MSKRRQAREMALQMLYQRELGEATEAQVFLHYRPEEHRDGGRLSSDGASDPPSDPVQSSALDYAKTLVSGVLDKQEEIDRLITEQADNWRLERMPPVDRNILRLAVYEMMCQEDVPKLVVLDEAIELAKRFGTENSGRFVNGLLDGLLKARPFPGSLT